jgi:hypothetical protein
MALINFNEWKKLVESRADELKCPHPEDKDYCKQWNLWIKGEISTAPVYKKEKSIGHYQGPKARLMLTDREKQRGGSSRKGGRYDWRKES